MNVRVVRLGLELVDEAFEREGDLANSVMRGQEGTCIVDADARVRANLRETRGTRGRRYLTSARPESV